MKHYFFLFAIIVSYSSVSLLQAQTLNDRLLEAVKANDTTTVKDLIAKGADVNARDEKCFSTLHWAVFLGSIELVEILIHYGADVNYECEEATPVTLAAILSFDKIFDLLLKYSEDIIDYNKIGSYFFSKNEYDQALLFFKKSLDMKLLTLDDDHPDIALSYSNIGSVFYHKGDYDKALEYQQKALGIELKVFGDEHPYVALSYSYIGLVFYHKGDYDKALEYIQKSLNIRLKTLGAEHPDVATSYNNIGYVYGSKGEYDKALEYIQKSLNIRLKTLGAEHPDVATSYINIANVYNSKGKYDKALEYYQKAMEIQLKVLGNEHPNVVSSYNNIGFFYSSKGEYDKALEYYGKSLEINVKIFGENHTNTASTYNNIGQVYNTKGDYDKALEYYQKSLGIWLKTLGEDHHDVAISYNNIGGVYGNQGEYDQALEYYQRSLGISLKTLGEDHPNLETIYNNLGMIHGNKREYNKALVYLKKSLRISIKFYGEYHPIVARIYNNIGSVYESKGEYDKSLEYCNKALNIVLKTLGDNNPVLTSNVYFSISYVYDSKGDYDKSIEYAQKSINALIRDYKDSSIYSTPTIKNDIIFDNGLLKSIRYKSYFFMKRNQDNHDLTTSFDGYKFALQLIDRIRLGYQSESAKLSIGEDSYYAYINGYTVCQKLYEVTKDSSYLFEAYRFAEKSKTGVLMEALSESKAKNLAGIPDSVIQYERRLKDQLVAYDKHLNDEQSKGDSANIQRLQTLQNAVFELKQEYERMVKRLEKDYPSYFALKYQTRSASVSDIQRLLPDSAVMLEYFLTDSALAVFCISKNGFSAHHTPIDSNFEILVRRYRQLLSRGSKMDYAQFANQSHELYRLLLAPVHLPEKINRLIIIPDGLLSYIPFETLVIDSARDRKGDYSRLAYLIKRYAVSYSYSATLWTDLAQKKSSRARNEYIGFAPVFSKESKTGYVAKSHAIFLADTAERATRNMIDRDLIAAIPATKDEVIGVLDFMNAQNMKAEALIFGKANESEVKSKALAGYRYVHFATHGFINESRPAYSGLILAQDTSSAEDGVLYAGETYGLNLDADAVVLSACETGLGRQVRGEGIIGLTRGFLYAGARHVVVSLWQVADQSTADLMTDYFRLSAGTLSNDQSGALRRAKINMINSSKYAAPFYWSPFVVVGK